MKKIKIEKIRSEEELMKVLKAKYGGKKAIKNMSSTGYTKDMGKQYYSSAQSRAILNGE